MECKIRDISLYYEVKGTGKPVIMIHGYHVDHRLMAGCMEPVFYNRENYKRIYIDLPGMGGSECADWITNADVMLDVIVEFIEKIIPGENFILAGESYGGYLSRGILHRMPHRVDGLLLICPVIIADKTKRKLPEHIVLVRDEQLLSSLSQKDAEDFISDMVVQNQKTYERYHAEIVSGIRLGNGSFLDNFNANGYSLSFDVDAAVEYNKPVAILVGRQDACVGYKDAWDLLDHYPRATFAVLDMAGHNLQIEQEALFTHLVIEWLERVENTTKKRFLESERPFMNCYTVEKAQYEDLEEILALQKLAYLSEAEIISDYTIPPLLQTLDGIKEDFRNQTILKIEDEGKIIGSVRACEKNGICYIGRVIVHPERQNRGLGKLLMKEIEDAFNKCSKYSLFTGKLSMRNLHFYGSLGYTSIGKEKVNEKLMLVYFEKPNSIPCM